MHPKKVLSKKILHKGLDPVKCKTALKLCTSRIKVLRSKRDGQIKSLKRELAQLLEAGDDQTAMIRVEHLTREEKTRTAYDLIEIYCEQIVANLTLVDSQKSCPLTLKEAIASVIFASPRCPDVTELKDVQKQLEKKYGKEFVSNILELRSGCGVGALLIEKMSTRAPDGPAKVKLLNEIAKEHNITWELKDLDEKIDVIHTESLSGPTTFQEASKTIPNPSPQGPKMRSEFGFAENRAPSSMPSTNRNEFGSSNTQGFTENSVPSSMPSTNRNEFGSSNVQGFTENSVPSSTSDTARTDGNCDEKQEPGNSGSSRNKTLETEYIDDLVEAADAALEAALRERLGARVAATLSRIQQNSESPMSSTSEDSNVENIKKDSGNSDSCEEEEKLHSDDLFERYIKLKNTVSNSFNIPIQNEQENTKDLDSEKMIPSDIHDDSENLGLERKYDNPFAADELERSVSTASSPRSLVGISKTENLHEVEDIFAQNLFNKEKAVSDYSPFEESSIKFDDEKDEPYSAFDIRNTIYVDSKADLDSPFSSSKAALFSEDTAHEESVRSFENLPVCFDEPEAPKFDDGPVDSEVLESLSEKSDDEVSKPPASSSTIEHGIRRIDSVDSTLSSDEDDLESHPETTPRLELGKLYGGRRSRTSRPKKHSSRFDHSISGSPFADDPTSSSGDECSYEFPKPSSSAGSAQSSGILLKKESEAETPKQSSKYLSPSRNEMSRRIRASPEEVKTREPSSFTGRDEPSGIFFNDEAEADTPKQSSKFASPSRNEMSQRIRASPEEAKTRKLSSFAGTDEPSGIFFNDEVEADTPKQSSKFASPSRNEMSRRTRVSPEEVKSRPNSSISMDDNLRKLSTTIKYMSQSTEKRDDRTIPRQRPHDQGREKSNTQESKASPVIRVQPDSPPAALNTKKSEAVMDKRYSDTKQESLREEIVRASHSNLSMADDFSMPPSMMIHDLRRPFPAKFNSQDAQNKGQKQMAQETKFTTVKPDYPEPKSPFKVPKKPNEGGAGERHSRTKKESSQEETPQSDSFNSSARRKASSHTMLSKLEEEDLEKSSRMNNYQGKAVKNSDNFQDSPMESMSSLKLNQDISVGVSTAKPPSEQKKQSIVDDMLKLSGAEKGPSEAALDMKESSSLNNVASTNRASHVHPKLPDYDDLASRMEAIRQGRF